MTTTAATTNTSASTSTPPKDSPGLHDYDDDDDDVDGSSKSRVEQHQKLEHNQLTKQKCQNNLEQSPSPPQQPPPSHPSPPSQQRLPSPLQPQSTKVDVSNTSISDSNSITVEPPTQTTPSIPAAIVNDTQRNQNLEQSTSSQQQLQQSTTNSSNNSTEQKRPMNAFLLFCKRQRSLVKEKYPNLENRGITKILGDWWSKLDKEQKSKYTDLARQHKEAFMKANPDFKWCKTPNVSNINNNISINDTDNESCNNSNTNQHQQSQNSQRLQLNNRQPQSATNVELLSMQSAHHPMEVLHHTTNSMDTMLKSRQQLEAPKPPKKRFLERNDSLYTSKNSYGPNQNDTNSHSTDVVPYISLDQDFLDRVIDKAFSEDSSSSPSGVNSCKCSNRNTTNLTAANNNPTSFSSSSSTSNYTTNIDEPVDFSMNRTINATSQQIINNLVEKMLSDGSDNSSSFSKMNGTDSVRPQPRPPVRRDNPDDT